MSNRLNTKQSRKSALPRRSTATSRTAGRVPAAPAAAEPLDQGMLPGLLGYQLRVAQLAVFRDFEAGMKGLGISPGRVGVLELVQANPGLSQSRLARAVGLDRSSLVPVLDGLERRGLLERGPGPDRRSNALRLTAAGKRFLEKVTRRVHEHEARMTAPLSATERRQLIALLARLTGPAG